MNKRFVFGMMLSSILLLSACGDNGNSKDNDYVDEPVITDTQDVTDTSDNIDNANIDLENPENLEDSETTETGEPKRFTEAQLMSILSQPKIVMGDYQTSDYDKVASGDTLYDSDSINISLNGVGTHYSHHSTIRIRYLNKTASKIKINANNVGYLNGIGFDILHKEIELLPGKTDVVALEFNTPYEDVSLENNMYTIMYKINVVNESGDVLESDREVAFKLKEGKSNFEIPVSRIQVNGPVFYDVTSIFVDPETKEIGLLGFVFNNTNEPLHLNISECTVNGNIIKQENMVDTELSPYEYTRLDIKFNKDYLNSLGIDAIQSISLKPFNVVDSVDSTEYNPLGTWLINYKN